MVNFEILGYLSFHKRKIHFEVFILLHFLQYSTYLKTILLKWFFSHLSST